MYGPFHNSTDTDAWLDSHNVHSGGEETKIFSMWDESVEPGTPEKAQSCGVLIGRNRPLDSVTPG